MNGSKKEEKYKGEVQVCHVRSEQNEAVNGTQKSKGKDKKKKINDDTLFTFEVKGLYARTVKWLDQLRISTEDGKIGLVPKT